MSLAELWFPTTFQFLAESLAFEIVGGFGTLTPVRRSGEPIFRKDKVTSLGDQMFLSTNEVVFRSAYAFPASIPRNLASQQVPDHMINQGESSIDDEIKVTARLVNCMWAHLQLDSASLSGARVALRIQADAR